MRIHHSDLPQTVYARQKTWIIFIREGLQYLFGAAPQRVTTIRQYKKLRWGCVNAATNIVVSPNSNLGLQNAVRIKHRHSNAEHKQKQISSRSPCLERINVNIYQKSKKMRWVSTPINAWCLLTHRTSFQLINASVINAELWYTRTQFIWKLVFHFFVWSTSTTNE